MNATRGSALSMWALLVVLCITIAFYVGLTIGQPAASSSNSTATSTTIATGAPAAGDYYSNPSQWQTYSNSSAGYSIAYPIDFSVDEINSPAPSTDWRANNIDQALGINTFTLTVPAAFEPQTNFADAKLTVGYSQNDVALRDCLIAQNGEVTAAGPLASPQGTKTIGNATFTVFTSSNAGAGQRYDTTSYRTTHAGACYAVEYTVHSAQLGNYPSSYGLQQFDGSKVDALLDRILGTFQFR